MVGGGGGGGGGGASQIPTLNFFTPPSTRSPTSGHDPGNIMKILFNMFPIFYLWEHTQSLDMLMIFDLLTSPQGHQFDPRMKMLLAFSSACHSHQFDMLHDHVWKKKKFDPLGTPSAPKSHPWGMTQATELKFRLICFVSFICENIHKVWYKNLWNWHGNRNLMIFDLWPHPKVTRGGAKFFFAVARPIHVSSSHSKFVWISSNGLGGDSITDRQQVGIWFLTLKHPNGLGGDSIMIGWTDRRTEVITISPSLF